MLRFRLGIVFFFKKKKSTKTPLKKATHRTSLMLKKAQARAEAQNKTSESPPSPCRRHQLPAEVVTGRDVSSGFTRCPQISPETMPSHQVLKEARKWAPAGTNGGGLHPRVLHQNKRNGPPHAAETYANRGTPRDRREITRPPEVTPQM